MYHGLSMNPSCISYAHAPKTTALFLDYLYHFDRVRNFYSGPPSEITSYHAVAREISSLYPHRRELTEILAHQNHTFGCGEVTHANIQRLRDPRTFAVVTGQQVGLFSGPAFTLYKALTAVKLAQSLTNQGLECVPVFWLATEDHDLEEVAKTAVLDEAGELIPLEVAGDRPAPRCSVGYVKLSTQVEAMLDRLGQFLPEGASRAQLLEDLRQSYSAGIHWGEAFARLMARIFSRFGVVLLDPLNESVHRLARGIYQKALQQAPRLRHLLEERSKRLINSGYHAQVHVAEDSTLLFAARRGNRELIRQRGKEFYLEGQDVVTLENLQTWVADRPLDFTPSALLRPIVQDSILPTVAYVAGPAELAYLAQSQAFYPEFGRPLPVVLPRASFTLADRRQERLLQKYHLTLEDVWQGEERLRRKIAAAGLGEHGGDGKETWAEHLDQAERALQEMFERLQRDVEPIDPTLLDAARNAHEKMAYQLERLRSKISRAALERSEILKRHEQELLRFLLPAGNFQEREVGGVYFLGRVGYELLDRLLGQISTRCSDHQFLIC